MYGAILGDIIGSPYEFKRGFKTKVFPLFVNESTYTDDTVMTIAVAVAFMRLPDGFTDEEAHASLVRQMKRFGRMYWNAGYGNRFFRWLISKNPEPYNSYGNGSAMRVSSVAWLFDELDEVRRCARLSAEVTHNHPEGIKGAEATASAIFLARTGSSKEEIKQYIVENFGYDLSRTCNQIRPNYRHIESCQETVPEAITAFLEGENFEDVIRTAVSLGGDCDTLTAIAGSIAEGFYGVPKELREECCCRLPDPLLEVLKGYTSYIEDGDAAGKAPLDVEGIEELARILSSRGVPHNTGLTISLLVSPGTRTMIDWLEENPQVSTEEMCKKALELNKVQRAEQLKWLDL